MSAFVPPLHANPLFCNHVAKPPHKTYPVFTAHRRPASATINMVKTPVATPVPSGCDAQPAAPQTQRWLITVCGAPVDEANALRARIERECAAHGGEVEEWRVLGPRAHELAARVPAAVEEPLRRALYGAGQSDGADVVLQPFAAVRGGKGLAVFDLDSTLIAEETIDELAREAGAQERVQALTRRAMAGDLAFRDALAERVATLQGLDIDALERVKLRATLTPGAKECVAALKRTGCVTAVVSGGFNFLAQHVRDVLGLDYAFANTLEVRDGRLTGRTVGEVVDAQFKADALTRLANKYDIPRERVMAVGDGSNDVIMLQRAGLGVAFNAKPKVQSVSKARVNQPRLDNVLYLLGLDDQQILDLVKD